MSLNKVMLIGNAGKDPDVRHLESGVSTASFSLATTERYRDRNEEETKASLAMIHKSVKGIHYRMSLKLEPPKEQSREER